MPFPLLSWLPPPLTWHCVVCCLAHKAECALRADDEVLDDLDGVVSREVHQCIQAVACGGEGGGGQGGPGGGAERRGQG
jgi:hypothetical protein